jgi:hypothetical protein
MPKRIFLSYSRQDEPWRARLVTTLAPLARADEIDLWDDSHIAPGADWAGSIEAQIDRSNVAVLLVSAAYLASGYVVDHELPRIVAAARAGRLTLVWVPVSTALWEVTELQTFQAAIDPGTPLDHMSQAQADAALASVARAIAAGRTLSEIGSAMKVIDAAYDELSGVAGPHRVSARHTGASIAFEGRDAVAPPFVVITADELKRLPDDQHRLVQSLEQGMSEEFERWTTLRPRRATLTAREQAEYEAAGRDMCRELNALLDFIESELGKQLEDHYHGIRYACAKLVD